MAVAPSSFGPWYAEGIGTQLPPGALVPNQAGAFAGQGQLLVLDASGNGALADGTVPGLIGAGVASPGKLSDVNPVAGIAKTSAHWGFGAMSFSTLSGDGFSAADLGGVPAFAADANTLGRKSNVSGNNRPLVGMVYGLNDDGLARFWGGPMACATARTILMSNAYPLARVAVTDASASTATAERAMQRPKVKGTVTDVTFTGAAVAASNTDYVTVTIAVRSLATAYATPVTLATYDSRITGQGAVTAFVPQALILTAAVFLLETDVLTITTTKGGAGQTLTGEFLVNGKAL